MATTIDTVPGASEAICTRPTAIEVVAQAFELYGARPCFGERMFEIGGDGVVRFQGRFQTRSYAEVWERVETFSSGLKHEQLAGPGAFVGICGFGSIDWVVADLACLRLAAVSVPLQTGMSPADLQQIIRETELTCIVCSVEQIDAVFSVLPQCPSVRSLVVMDLREGDRAAETKVAARVSTALRVTIMTEVEQSGRALGIVPMVLPSARGERDPLMTLVYTSGSTGTPKGAIVGESVLREMWSSGFFTRLLNGMRDFPYVTVNYMPLNHVAGRANVIHSIVRGGVTYFVAKSDMSTLFEDIRLVRPTAMLLVPRVSSAIYQHFLGELVRRSEGVRDEGERERVAEALLAEMRESFLGDRLVILMTSTAPTPPDVVSFLERCFQVPVVDAYGTTEAGPLTSQNRVDPAGGVEWKLVDVPELGYRTTDRPYPRGSLHVKSRFVIPGYYKNERATKELFDEDGFLDTGDIMEQRGDDCLVWIDRAKNIVKLSQGEFVATSRLEGLYASRSAFIRQVFIHGDSFRSYVVAVVVPDVDAATSHLRARGVEVDDASLADLVRTEIHRIAREEHLRGHEVPRDLLLERVPFSVGNGLLTDSNKQSRPRLQARYGKQLEALYGAIERAQVEQLYGLRGESTASIAERVKKAIGVTLGITDVDVRQADQSFIQLGGDSLGAVGLEKLLHEITGVRVPVGLLLDPTSSIGRVVEYVEDALAADGRRTVTFADVHGAGARSVRADDIRIDVLLGHEGIEAARVAKPASELPGRAEVALLTGANGFLGRFLTLELLERLSSERRNLYALVRAPNDAAAFARLASSYETDVALSKRFAELTADGRLSVLAADLMKPRFGLEGDVYERLVEEVDLVVHNGALVNHALGYERLFEPNVLGTVEVLRFALTRRVKSVSYVSTVGVVGRIERAAPVREDEDLRTLVPERATETGYAAGYATSKWASELLLRDAHDKLGLPVAVFRPSEIMAHSAYRGQVNVADFFTRLLAGVVHTGLAPKSFYAPGASDLVKHHDGLGVDVVARSITLPSVNRLPYQPSCETYHVVNPYRDDGISLDVVVHWVKKAGYPVERVADYDEWYRIFRERLTSLPEPKRRHSPLAILDAWTSPHGSRLQAPLDSALLLERLRALTPSAADLPHVSEALIDKMLDDMAVLGVIERPRRMTG